MPNPRLGYILTALSAACSALNGSLSRYLLDDGMSAARLSQLRSAVSVRCCCSAALAAVLSATACGSPGPTCLQMAWLGIAGHRAGARDLLPGDRAHGHRRRARDPVPRAGAAADLAAVVHSATRASVAVGGGRALDGGCALVVDAPRGRRRTSTRSACWRRVAGAVTLAIYLTSSERAGQRYDAFTTLAWGFGFATLFWLVVAPVWTFPWELLDSARNVALALGVAVIGTLVPFLLLVTALRHLPAAHGRGGGDARARAGVGHRLVRARPGAGRRPRSPAASWCWRRVSCRVRPLELSMDVLVAGGHGQIARRLHRDPRPHGHTPRGLIRNPDHAADLEADGAVPVLCDLEHDDLRPHIGGAEAIVFAAGAGPGSGPERKQTVDLGGAPSSASRPRASWAWTAS